MIREKQAEISINGYKVLHFSSNLLKETPRTIEQNFQNLRKIYNELKYQLGSPLGP